MAWTGELKIYSNDGRNLLYYHDGIFEYGGSITLTSTGFTTSVGAFDYVYAGGNRFVGLARSVNAQTPDYGIGSTINIDRSNCEFYIVEESTMGKNVIINGVTYNDVPYVNIPLAAGGGNAKFVDTDSGDAASSDLRNGKKAWVDGNEVTGTVPVKTASDVTVSGKNVTAPAGIYDSPVTKAVADGSVTPTATIAGDEIGTTVSDYPVTATPGASVSAGYVSSAGSGSPVTKYIQVEEKTVTPTMAAQDITPSSGKLIKKCHVNAVDVSATATEATVPAGVTFFSNSLTRKTGTATFPTVSQDASTKVLSIA